MAFFVYLAVLGIIRQNPAHHVFALLLWPVILWTALVFESRHSKPWTRVLRQWLSMAVLLVGYWSVEWFSTPTKLEHLQNLWLKWDQTLLFQYGLQAAIESAGPVLPFVLEATYLLLYIIPTVALSLLYFYGSPSNRRQFLLTLLLGTFSVYAILPLVAVESPRRVFPRQDEPQVVTTPRKINTYLLDHMDISTGVFPSGHVAVAFATAFGLLGVLRRHRWIWGSAFLAGTLVFLATIYGRYHYSVDGMASIVITALASRASASWSAFYES